MKKFEKWQEKALKHEYSPNVYYGAKKGWQAVLEMLLSHDNGPCSFNKCNIRDIIEEELDGI